jgi:hypothetical protein
MKRKGNSKRENDGLGSEYDLSKLKGGVRGKYVARYRAGTNLALLAPDVRVAFPTDDAVNSALRSLMRHKRATAKSKRRDSVRSPGV